MGIGSVDFGSLKGEQERISQAPRLLFTGLNYHIWNSLKHLNPLDHWRPLSIKKNKYSGWENMLSPQIPNPLPPPPVSQWHHAERMIVWKSVKCSRHMLICVELSLCLSVCVSHLEYCCKINQLLSSKALVCFWDWSLFICES